MADWRAEFCEHCRAGAVRWDSKLGKRLHIVGNGWFPACTAPDVEQYIEQLRESLRQVEAVLAESRIQVRDGDYTAAMDELLASYLAEERDARRQAEAEIARLTAMLKQVDDVLVCSFITAKDGDYKTALYELIRQAIEQHDDPAMKG